MTDDHSIQVFRARIEALRRGEVTGAVCNCCGRNNDECQKLIALPVGFICSECVALCAEIIVGKATEPLPPDPPDAAQVRLRIFEVTRGWITGKHVMSDWLAIADAAALWVLHGRLRRAIQSSAPPEAAA